MDLSQQGSAIDGGLAGLSWFQATRLRFHLAVLSSIALPPYKGATFHGAFGWALQRISPLLYRNLFEPRPPAGAVPGAGGEASIPKPFVLIPPLEEDRLYPAGSRLVFELVLVGKAFHSLPACLYAVEQLGRAGLGNNPRGRFAIARVEAIRPSAAPLTLFCEEDGIWHDPGAPTSGEEVAAGWCDGAPSSITLEFLTRVRLYADNRLLRCAPDFETFMGRVLARLNMLTWAHHGFTLLDDAQKRDLLEQARSVQIEVQDLVWDDWSRYSGRQKKWMKFGGLLGRIRYTGDLSPFMPYLALGEWVHIGGKTSFGLGRYRIDLKNYDRVGDLSGSDKVAKETRNHEHKSTFLTHR